MMLRVAIERVLKRWTPQTRREADLVFLLNEALIETSALGTEQKNEERSKLLAGINEVTDRTPWTQAAILRSTLEHVVAMGDEMAKAISDLGWMPGDTHRAWKQWHDNRPQRHAFNATESAEAVLRLVRAARAINEDFDRKEQRDHMYYRGGHADELLSALLALPEGLR